MVMVPDVRVTWLCDGICPAAIITDFSIVIDAPEEGYWSHLIELAGEVNETTESLSVLLSELRMQK